MNIHDEVFVPKNYDDVYYMDCAKVALVALMRKESFDVKNQKVAEEICESANNYAVIMVKL